LLCWPVGISYGFVVVDVDGLSEENLTESKIRNFHMIDEKTQV
jgi:hypothetical protein